MKRTRITWGLRLLLTALTAAMMSGFASMVVEETELSDKEAVTTGLQIQQVEVNVDANRVTEPFNRDLFSIAGYAQLYQYGSDAAKKSAEKLQLQGTQARIETMMDQAFPTPDQFVPDNMFRFVDNTGDAYYQLIHQKGMEPVLLLAYNMPWLTEYGQLNEPPKDPSVWAESAAKIIEHYNGSGDQYRLNVKYVEVWNEPNLSMFWSTGDWEQYFQLFHLTAEIIHERFPGVMVGGPVLSPATKPEEFGKAFIDACGDAMDFFVYHSYGDPVEKISSDIEMWLNYIRNHTNQEPKLMVTEADNWFNGYGKTDYMIRRQFALLEHADAMIGFHHFTLMEYLEGNYVFGVVNQDGSVIEGTYWPYWLFRDSRGSIVETEVNRKPIPANDEFNPSVISTKSDDESTISTVYYSGSGGRQDKYNTKFSFELPKSSKDRIYTVSQVSQDHKGILASGIISGSKQSFQLRLDVGREEGIAITIKEVSGEEIPWTELTVSGQEIAVGDTFRAEVSVLNTTGSPIQGSLAIDRLPQGWQAVHVEGAAGGVTLSPGERALSVYDISVNEVTSGWVPITGVWTDDSSSVESIPLRMKSLWPVEISTIPDFSYMAPTETRSFNVKVNNKLSEAIAGTITLSVPEGFSFQGGGALVLAPGSEASSTFIVTAPDTIPEGGLTLSVQLNYQNRLFSSPIRLQIKHYNPQQETEIIDLSGFYNRDGFSYRANPGNGNLDGSGNNLPADTFPNNEKVRYMGVLFQTPNVSDNAQNVVTAGFQTVPVTPGSYSDLALLALATNGNKNESVQLNYMDGSQETVALQVTDWCAAAAYGEEKVIQFPHRHNSQGVVAPACGIFYTTLDVDPGKTLVSFALPDNNNVHIVSASLIESDGSPDDGSD